MCLEYTRDSKNLTTKKITAQITKIHTFKNLRHGNKQRVLKKVYTDGWEIFFKTVFNSLSFWEMQTKTTFRLLI